MVETPSGAPQWKRDDPDKDAEIGHCNKARHSLSQLKYKMLQEAADWADSVKADEHEKQALRDFSDLFSRAIEGLLGTASKVGDAGLQGKLLVDIELTTSLAASLGNLGKSNPFLEWRRLAANAKHTQPGRAVNSERPQIRRELIKTIALEYREKHPDSRPGACAGKKLKAVNKLLETNKLPSITKGTLTTDIKAIWAAQQKSEV